MDIDALGVALEAMAEDTRQREAAARAEGFRAGAEAMREAAAKMADARVNNRATTVNQICASQAAFGIAADIRSLDIPEDRP